MRKRMALRDRVPKYFSSAALVSLTTGPVKTGRVHCIQKVVWEIDKALGGGNYRARLYIEGHGYKHKLSEQKTPQAAVQYTYTEPVWLIPGEQLALDLDQCAAATTAEMNLTGFWQEEQEGVE